MKHLRILILIPLTLLLTGSVTQQHLMVVAKKRVTGGVTEPPATNLVGHWEADSGIYNDAGSTLASDGEGVYQWNGVVGGNFVQATSGDRPLYQTGTQNGLPGIEFVSSDFMAIGSALLTTEPLTVYVVASSTDITNAQGLFQIVNSGTTSTSYSMTIRSDQSGDPIYWWVRAGTNTEAITSTGISSGTVFTATGQSASTTDHSAWIDGGSLGASTTSKDPTGLDETAIGMARDSSPDQPLVGFIFEILVYDTAHDSTARAAVWSYLDAKWGL